MANQLFPPLLERDHIARGLILRLDDPIPEEGPGRQRQLEVLEMLVPFATQAITFALARSTIPPRPEPVDLARLVVVLRMLNALPGAFGFIARHLYSESVGAARPLLEGALLFRYFRARPERARDWFDHPETFRRPAQLREELSEAGIDPLYAFASELGDHVTAASLRMLAAVNAEGRRLELAVGGRYDDVLEQQACSFLLISAGIASDALIDTFMHDMPRLSARGARAFAQLMRYGPLELPRRNALAFAEAHLGQAPNAGFVARLRLQLDDFEAAAAREADQLDEAGMRIPFPGDTF